MQQCLVMVCFRRRRRSSSSSSYGSRRKRSRSRSRGRGKSYRVQRSRSKSRTRRYAQEFLCCIQAPPEPCPWALQVWLALDGNSVVSLDSAHVVTISWVYSSWLVQCNFTPVFCICFWLCLLILWMMVEVFEEGRIGVSNYLGLQLTCCGMDGAVMSFQNLLKTSPPVLSVCR